MSNAKGALFINRRRGGLEERSFHVKMVMPFEKDGVLNEDYYEVYLNKFQEWVESNFLCSSQPRCHHDFGLQLFPSSLPSKFLCSLFLVHVGTFSSIKCFIHQLTHLSWSVEFHLPQIITFHGVGERPYLHFLFFSQCMLHGSAIKLVIRLDFSCFMGATLNYYQMLNYVLDFNEKCIKNKI